MAQGKWASVRSRPLPWPLIAGIAVAVACVACVAAWEMRSQRDEMVRAWKGRP